MKGIYRDKRTGEIISKPHVHSNDEQVTDLAGQIVERLESKRAKGYPASTVLIINCVSNGIILPSEWKNAVERVEKGGAHSSFREVFILEMLMSHSATLHGIPKRRTTKVRASV